MRRTSARKQQQQQQRLRLCRDDIICANVGSNIAGTTRVSRRALCKMRLAERARTRAMRATPRAGQRDAALFRRPFLLLPFSRSPPRPYPPPADPFLALPSRALSCRFAVSFRALDSADSTCLAPPPLSRREIALDFISKISAVYCLIALPRAQKEGRSTNVFRLVKLSRNAVYDPYVRETFVSSLSTRAQIIQTCITLGGGRLFTVFEKGNRRQMVARYSRDIVESYLS